MRKRPTLSTNKKAPRPVGRGVQVVVRWQPAALSALDAWLVKQKDWPSRAEAIRRLVDIALNAEGKN